jgi:hypothetical protein
VGGGRRSVAVFLVQPLGTLILRAFSAGMVTDQATDEQCRWQPRSPFSTAFSTAVEKGKGSHSSWSTVACAPPPKLSPPGHFAGTGGTDKSVLGL